MDHELTVRTDSSTYNKGTQLKQQTHEEVSAALNHHVILKAFLEGRAKDVSDDPKVNGEPCIVIGSGGSLDEALPLLKDWKGGLICTTSHALSLVRFGIEPTHIVVLDPFCDYEEIKGYDWSKTRTKLITVPTAWPTLISYWPNEILLYLQNNGQANSIYANTIKRQYMIRQQLPGGARLRDAEFKWMIRTEITLFACSPPLQMFMAALLGYNKTFLVGCDFAYTHDKERFTDWTIDEEAKEITTGNASFAVGPTWKSTEHPLAERIEAVEKDPSLKLITTKTGLKSEPVHLFYKKNMFTAMRLSMQDCFNVGSGAMSELPQVSIQELIEKQGDIPYLLTAQDKIDMLEEYLASVGAFVILAGGGFTFVEANDPVPQLTRYMESMARKYACECGVSLTADDDLDHGGDVCPSCKTNKLTKVFTIDVKENIDRMKKYLKRAKKPYTTA